MAISARQWMHDGFEKKNTETDKNTNTKKRTFSNPSDRDGDKATRMRTRTLSCWSFSYFGFIRFMRIEPNNFQRAQTKA